MPSADAADSFISRWKNSGAAERANYQMFLSELCALLDVTRPDPTSPDPEKNLYVFDRAITRVHTDGSSSTNYIDLYKAGHFVCETKQGVGDSSDCSGDHRSPQQSTIPGTDSTSSQPPISNTEYSIPWPDRLPDQVTLIRQFLTTDPTATPEQLSAHFGRKNQKRAEQIEGIVETLRGLGTIGSQIT
jgi:hypothetical protein